MSFGIKQEWGKTPLIILVAIAALCLQGWNGHAGEDKKKQLETGAKLYIKYACNGCHGKEGAGLGDLREAYKKYNPEQLEAYIKNPAKYSNVRMPAFEDIIEQNEYPDLVLYVISLGKQAQARK